MKSRTENRRRQYPLRLNRKGHEITDPDELPCKLVHYYEVLFKDVDKYLKKNQPSIAIIFAQTVVELCTEQTLKELLETHGTDHLYEPMLHLFQTFNICSDRLLGVYNALSNEELQEAAFWPRLKRLNKLRNEIVHKGKSCSREEAQKLIGGVGQFMTHMKTVVVRRHWELDPRC